MTGKRTPGHKLLAWLLALAGILGGTLAGAQAQDCLARSGLGANPRHYTGAYRNGAFSFSTQIPPGYTGLDADDPQYQRGFTLLLPDSGTLAVGGEVNSSDLTPQSAARFFLDVLRQQAARVVTFRTTSEQLDGRPGVRLSAEFLCPHSEVHYRYWLVASVSPHRRVLYTLEWQGTPGGEPKADRLLRELEASWHFLPDR